MCSAARENKNKTELNENSLADDTSMKRVLRKMEKVVSLGTDN